MLFKAIFIVVIIAMFWGVDGRDVEHNGVVKRGTLNKTNQDLKALSDVVKALKERIKELESKKGWCKDGTPGAAGSPGKPGKDGRDGSQGKDGAPGKDGSPGPRGRDGRDGQHGSPGPRGIVVPISHESIAVYNIFLKYY
ncbi:collagen alpha-1(I) chain [Exaiptasia diaphana]|uniref:Uncharacterized protein n=1 Tax=Exaiptasia diaphana TaxID=2652724 RepID=A0A913XYT3_EXADI|nr:collagen alpha-1(I) chain [Exaiptasia diaphana]